MVGEETTISLRLNKRKEDKEIGFVNKSTTRNLVGMRTKQIRFCCT